MVASQGLTSWALGDSVPAAHAGAPAQPSPLRWRLGRCLLLPSVEALQPETEGCRSAPLRPDSVAAAKPVLRATPGHYIKPGTGDFRTHSPDI